MSSIKFSREWAMPNADTFSIPVIGAFVKRHLKNSKVSIDPFARNKDWATYTNDLNPETNAKYHLDAFTFLQMLFDKSVSADLLIFDPPYSPRQVKEVYGKIGRHFGIKDQQNTGRWTAEKKLISQILQPKGVVLSFGWSTQGMGLKNGFSIEEIMIVCHGGAHNDTICMAERKNSDQGFFKL